MSPIRHLTDEQLGAHADGALAGAALAEAERHLAACAECRARVAELAAADAALGRALTHDPGEAYFASFAARVSERIAAEGAGARAAAPAPRAWWRTPRALAWAGSALGLCVVAALVVVMARTHGPGELAASKARSDVGAPVTRELAAPQASAPAPDTNAANRVGDAAQRALEPSARGARPLGTPGPASRDAQRVQSDELRQRAQSLGAPRADARDRSFARAPVAAPPATSAPAPTPAPQPGNAPRPAVVPERLMEMKTLANGEQVAVRHEGEPALPAAPRQASTPSGFAKPGAQPMALQAPVPAPAAKSLDEHTLEPTAKRSQSLVLGGATPVHEDAIAGAVASAWQLCGTIVDDHARPVTGAAVTNVATGAGAVTGADGAFCVPATDAKLTVSVLAIGFRSTTATWSSADAGRSASVRLTPVETVSGVLRATMRASGAADSTVRVARAASTQARALNTAAGWRQAADAWDRALGMARASSVDAVRDARFHLAEALVNTWRRSQADVDHHAAQVNVEGYLAIAPAGPLRTLAEGWRKELAP